MTSKIKLQNIISIIIAGGIALMIFGILQGELQAIMRKAVMICLECIGIG